MENYTNKTGGIKPKNSHQLVLIGAPSWGVDHPFHSLVLVAGVVREADFEVNLYDFNIDFYNFVSKKEDRKYWTGAYASRWDANDPPHTLWEKYKKRLRRRSFPEEIPHMLWEKHKKWLHNYFDTLLSENNPSLIAFTVKFSTRYFFLYVGHNT